ncbi:MAG: hypothetical protein K6F88_02150 [Ruminococcus sp.]|nr:hypothetical protein [Ruminococcus sp.]
MDELTIGVLSSAVWDLIKKGATVSANQIKEKLKDWILSDDELNTLAETLNRASMDEIVSERALQEYLHSNEEIIKLLFNSKPNVTVNPTIYGGDGDIIIVGEGSIFINRETNALKTNNIDFNIFDKFNRFHSVQLLASFLATREKYEIQNNRVAANIYIPERIMRLEDCNFVMVLFSFSPNLNLENYCKENYSLYFELDTSDSIEQVQLQIKDTNQQQFIDEPIEKGVFNYKLKDMA